MILAIKRLLAVLIRSLLQVCYAPLKFLRTRDKITLISRQQDSASLDLQLLADAYQRAYPQWNVTVLTYEFHSSFRKKIGYFPHVFAQMRHIAQSRLVVVDTYCIPVSVLQHKRDLRVIQLWHALGSIKKFGFSILDVGEGSSSTIARTMRMHKNYDVVLTSSSASVASFAEAFDVPLDLVKVNPLPRVDVLRDRSTLNLVRERILEAHPELATGRNVLFAPTFQKGQQFAADELHKFFLRHGYNLIAKPHPVALVGSDSMARKYQDFSAFEFLSIADALVTDYSSIMLEAGVADVPVFILAPDFEHYSQTRSFYIDFAEEVPSTVSSSFEGLLAELDAFDCDLSRLRTFTAKFVELPIKQSCTDGILGISAELLGR